MKESASQGILTIPPSSPHSATVIFLHGMSQSSLSWKTIIEGSLAPALRHVKWVLPQAPKRPVSFHQGENLPSWFDIAKLPPNPDEYDEPAILESINMIESLILAEVNAGLEARRVVLVGFSQGAATSLMVALRTSHRLGGLVSLSGWIPPRARHTMHATPWLRILWCHGTADKSIPASHATEAIGFLHETAGIPHSQLRLDVYNDLEHTTNDMELKWVGSWLGYILRYQW